MFNLLSATGTGLQIGSVGAAFALAVGGASLVAVAAVCGTGYLAGETFKLGD